jgi:hypothetical protein
LTQRREEEEAFGLVGWFWVLGFGFWFFCFGF